MWRDIDGMRLAVHRIHPCDDPFFHPHPWPCAIRVLKGRYEMPVGFGAGVDTPAVAGRLYLAAGSLYEMTHPDMWHAVKAHTEVLSIMLMGKPWGREMPDYPEEQLRPLSDDAKEEILTEASILGNHAFGRLPR